MRRAIICLVFLLFAYPVLGQSVKVKMDKTVDFSRYKTYTWASGSPAKNPIINQMIIDSIEQQLAARGLSKVAAGGDLQVLYVAAVDLDLQLVGVDWSSKAYATGAIYNPPPPMDVRKGMLVVDLMDKKTERYIWRATATETLTHAPSGDIPGDAKKVEGLVKRAVDKMFKKYPATK